MKVFCTQGHEKGIGLEVFFKTCLLLSPTDLAKIKLFAYKESVEATLATLKIPFECFKDLEIEWLKKSKHSQSFTSLTRAMEASEKGGVLYTLPTSKDQFPGFPGHTEYFRSHYKKAELGMFFSSQNLKVLLLSDHVAVKDLSNIMTEELIYSRLKTALKTLKDWNWPVSRVLVSGLNPHAGENGMIGDEDKRITKALERLRSQLKFEMSGPWPGDTMLFEKKFSNDILVYVFHDQGLGVFKGLEGFVGSNITLGLPYPRVSPDHGTSFSLFGKNVADYRGCSYSLKEALMLLDKVSHG